MKTSSQRRADPLLTVFAGPAVRLLEAARDMESLTREQAALANRSKVTTADDYLRALAKLGFLEKGRVGRLLTYRLTHPGRALVERRSLL